MKEQDEKKYKPQVETLGTLARKYKLDVRTFKKCIKAISHKLRYKQEHRRTLTVREVQYIVEHMGEPDIVD